MKIQYEFFLRDLAVCIKTKKIFYLFYYYFFFFFTKTRYLIPDLYLYSIKIQTDIDQNAVKYLRKITDFLKECFLKNVFFGLGPTRPMWLGWTKPPVHGHWPKPVTQTNYAHVKFYACMESHCSCSFLQIAKTSPLFKVQMDSCSFLRFLSVSVFLD